MQLQDANSSGPTRASGQETAGDGERSSLEDVTRSVCGVQERRGADRAGWGNDGMHTGRKRFGPRGQKLSRGLPGGEGLGKHGRWSRNEVTYQSGRWEGGPHFLSASLRPSGRGPMTSAAAANDVRRRQTPSNLTEAGQPSLRRTRCPGQSFLWSPPPT